MRTIPAARRSVQQPKKRAAIFPSSRPEAYFDRMRIWLVDPLTKTQIKRLQIDRSRLRKKNQPAKFDPRYRQRLDIYTASPATLRAFVALRPVHLLTYFESALDWPFANPMLCREANDFFDRHFVKRFHRGEAGVRFYKGVTRYTDPRRAASNVVSYADRPSRITGEVDCLHVEYRLRRRAFQRLGINSVADLLAFDHYAFWQARLRLADLKYGTVGRRYLQSRSRGRRFWSSIRPRGYRFDVNQATGVIIANAPLDRYGRRLDGVVQRVLDHFGSRFRTSDCLIPFDVGHLLPASNTPSFSTIVGTLLPLAYLSRCPVDQKASSIPANDP